MCEFQQKIHESIQKGMDEKMNGGTGRVVKCFKLSIQANIS